MHGEDSSMRTPALLKVFVALYLASTAIAQQPGLDPRMKADLLVVIAHPDDDVLIGGILARLVLDEHKRVAVVYATNGDGGGNAVADESGQALGKVREIEARHALQILGIDNVWFLGGHDTPGQNPLRSLDRWNHGEFLDNLVRLVRITRPDVIATWLPAQVAGENHGDHQASGVLAVEAFDMAGDPGAFPEQLSMPREVNGMSNLVEGLEPWQPKKIYFFTDAFEVFNAYWHDPASRSPFRSALDESTGPVYRADEISPSQHASYAEIVARQQAEYATQEGAVGTAALDSRNYSLFAYPEPLIFGNSLVGGSVTGDIFESITARPIPFHSIEQSTTLSSTGITLEIGDPWRFYSDFWRAHDLGRIAALLPVPELGAGSGERLHIPLIACNHTRSAANVSITPDFPSDWPNPPASIQIGVAPGLCATAFVPFVTPPAKQSAWHALAWKATTFAEPVGTVTLRLFVGKSGGLPQ
jgi:LmbE family N-acetylglucosaminyl deacetylase